MSIKKVFDDLGAPSRRRWYNEASVDESMRDSILLKRINLRLSYLEKKVNDLEHEVKSLKEVGSKKVA